MSNVVVDVNKTRHGLEPSEVAEYESLFETIDLDSSGSVTVEEIHGFRRLLRIGTDSMIELEDWVMLVDQVGDGEIQLKEFVVFMHLARNGGKTDRLVYVKGKEPKKNVQLETLSTRKLIWVTLDDPTSSKLAEFVNSFFMLLIFLSVVTYCMETIHDIEENLLVMKTFFIVEAICIGTFSLEFLLRFLTCPNKTKFSLQVLNWIDLASIAPFYLNFLLDGQNASRALRVARLARVGRVLKLGKSVVWLRLYYSAIDKAKFPLAMAFFVLLLDIVIFASLVFYAERGPFDQDLGIYVRSVNSTEPARFQSIFDGCYWALITITTVGYGDFYPETGSGKLVGMATLITGILMMAIPISIFTTHFQSEYSEFKKQRQRLLQRKREEEDDENALSSDLGILMGKLTYGLTNTLVNEKSRNIFDPKLAKNMKKRFTLGMGPSVVVPSVTIDLDQRLEELEHQSLSPKHMLREGLKALEEAGISSLSQRQYYRKLLLRKQMLRIVDRKRERLWVDFRVLERKYREDLMNLALEKYAQWFLETEADLERDILSAVLKIQAIFRGGMQRMLYSSRLVNLGKKAKRNVEYRKTLASGKMALEIERAKALHEAENNKKKQDDNNKKPQPRKTII